MSANKRQSAVICMVSGLLVILLLTAIDQYTKLLALKHLKDRASVVLIPNVLEFKYLENRGIAFGLFQGKIPLFLILCILFFLVALYLFIRIPKTEYYLPLILILLGLVSGAAGNFIDRAFRGAVIDFIYVSLIDFPIFNVADIYVVCSGILLVFMVGLKYKDEDFAFISPKHKG